MASRAGISGVAVGMATAGGLLLWTGIINRPVVAALQDILQGRNPGTTGEPTGPALADVRTSLDDAAASGALQSGGPQPAGPAAGTGAIQTFVETARAQLGKPYVWGAAGPNSFDCSGLVTYCLKAAGLDNQRRVTGQYLVWTGAMTVPTSSCRYGDLVCWAGHIGIAISGTRMIHAPSAGRPVQEGNIWYTPPPVIRRIRASQESTSPAPVGTGGTGGGNQRFN